MHTLNDISKFKDVVLIKDYLRLILAVTKYTDWTYSFVGYVGTNHDHILHNEIVTFKHGIITRQIVVRDLYNHTMDISCKICPKPVIDVIYDCYGDNEKLSIRDSYSNYGLDIDPYELTDYVITSDIPDHVLNDVAHSKQ